MADAALAALAGRAIDVGVALAAALAIDARRARRQALAVTLAFSDGHRPTSPGLASLPRCTIAIAQALGTQTPAAQRRPAVQSLFSRQFVKGRACGKLPEASSSVGSAQTPFVHTWLPMHSSSLGKNHDSYRPSHTRSRQAQSADVWQAASTSS